MQGCSDGNGCLVCLCDDVRWLLEGVQDGLMIPLIWILIYRGVVENKLLYVSSMQNRGKTVHIIAEQYHLFQAGSKHVERQ